MTIEELVGRILALCEEDAQEAQERLDDLVHDAKACEAARINNQGVAGQVDFLAGPQGDFSPRDLAQHLNV